MRGSVVVAGGPQDQAGPRPVKEEPDADDQRQREVHEGVLAEQNTPDQRDIGEARNIQMRRQRNLFADEAGADQAGKADAENGQREAGGDLVDRKPQRHQREDQRHQNAGDDAAQRADDDRAGSQAPPKPQAAPTIIMPSTPRLSTPERSVTSSPVAASSSGVEAASTARMMASMSPTGHLW